MELRLFYIAVEMQSHYGSAMMVMGSGAREAHYAVSPSPLEHLLLRVAKHAMPRTLRQHPRGPQLPKRKGYIAGTVTLSHVSAVRMLKAGIAG